MQNKLKDYSLTLTCFCADIFCISSENEKWWESEPLKKTVETMVDATSLDVETTGYGLLIYVHRTLTQDAIPIMRWLVRQRNHNGGFQSTQVRYRKLNKENSLHTPYSYVSVS